MLRTLLLGALGIGGTAAVASAAIAVTARPEPCVVRVAAARIEIVSADEMRTRWESFVASASTTGQASFVVTEAQATATAIEWARQRELPVEDVRITFCPDGRIEAAATMTGLGAPLHGQLRGTLDTSSGRALVRVESLRVGALPESVATQLANSAVQSAQLDRVPLDGLKSVMVSDGTVTLTGGR